MRNEIGGVKLAKKIVRCVIGEAHIGAEEFLVQDGSAEKVSHLLLFHWLARKRQSVAAARSATRETRGCLTPSNLGLLDAITIKRALDRRGRFAAVPPSRIIRRGILKAGVALRAGSA